jgi:PIN domain nuclease of toxin-antitoxin system
MGYLIDTHIFLWFVSGDKKLPKTLKQKIEDINTPCFISIASFWEITIKKQLGKLELKLSLKELFQYAERNNIEIVQIAYDHLNQLSKLPNIHGDPFDRLMISQVISEKLILLSVDETLRNYKVNVEWK